MWDGAKTKEEFIYWYNELKPHRALNFDELETPSQAFIRKMKLLGLKPEVSSNK